MKIFGKNLKKEILYIAEIGVNHEGSLGKCLKLIKQAKKAGADVVKFQCYTPEMYVSTEEQKFERIKNFYLSEKSFLKIIKFCKKIKIHFLFTPLSHDWVNFISKHSSYVKIASGDLDFEYLIKKIIQKKLNIFLSTGISSFAEIKKTTNLIKKSYKKNSNRKLFILHCVSNYPVKIKDANLKNILFLKKNFTNYIGYSNHVIGINACLVAISLGARIVEFHFTDNKKRKFRDHQLSLDSRDVKKLISLGNEYNNLLGNYIKDNSSVKIKDRQNLQGIIAAKNILKGKKLNFSDLTFARPNKHFHSNQLKKLIGKRLKVDLKKGHTIKKRLISKL